MFPWYNQNDMRQASLFAEQWRTKDWGGSGAWEWYYDAISVHLVNDNHLGTCLHFW